MFRNHRWHPLATYITITGYIRDHFNARVKKIHESYFRCLLVDDFHIKRDPHNLICFANGVYDIKQSKFRDGLPEDYCTYCTNITYTYNNNPEFNYYLGTVFPYKEDLKQFLCIMYHIFKGHKIFVQPEFKDDSGMSFCYRLIKMTFGSYIEDYSNNFLLNASDIKQLQNNFKGRTIMGAFSNCYHSFSQSMITDKPKSYYHIVDLPSTNILSFKSTFRDIITDNPVNHVYKKTVGLGHQMRAFSLALMNKIISIEQSPLKVLYFNQNNIFVQDITHYILNLYDDIIYN